jgi:hypothetical protein
MYNVGQSDNRIFSRFSVFGALESQSTVPH